MNAEQAQARLGPFHLLRVLASHPGAMVCEAIEPVLDQHLCLTLLPRRRCDANRLLAGARSARGLRHPNIVGLQDAGCVGQTAFLATEYVEGEPLARFRERVGELPVLQGLALAAQLLAALQFAHAQGFVHGAISPDHLLVSRSGQLKIGGWGWAAAAPDKRGDASPYRSPEQLLGMPADQRADLYAAAVVIYEILAGGSPWPSGGGSPGRVPQPVRTWRACLPLGLDAVFRRALAPEADARFDSAAALSAALQAAIGRPVWVRADAARRARSAPVPPALADRRAARFELAFAAACFAAVAWTTSVLMGGSPAITPQAIAEVTGPGASAGAGRRVSSGPVGSVPDATRAAAGAEPSRVPPPLVIPVEAPPAEPPAAQPTKSAPMPVERARPLLESKKVSVPQPARGRLQAAQQPAREVPAAKPVVRRARAAVPVAARLDCRQDLALAREMCAVFRCALAEYRRHPVCVQMHAQQQRVRDQYAQYPPAP